MPLTCEQHPAIHRSLVSVSVLACEGLLHLFTMMPRNIINGISAALPLMLDDPGTNVIVIRGSGGKAFCAGGDIKALHGAGQQVRAAYAAVLQGASFYMPFQNMMSYFCALLASNMFVFVIFSCMCRLQASQVRKCVSSSRSTSQTFLWHLLQNPWFL
jgi:hypothetical protein